MAKTTDIFSPTWKDTEEAELRSPVGNLVEKQLHPPVGRVHVDGDEVRLRAADEARLPVRVEPLAQLQAEREVGDLEQNGFGHPFSLARPRRPN